MHRFSFTKIFSQFLRISILIINSLNEEQVNPFGSVLFAYIFSQGQNFSKSKKENVFKINQVSCTVLYCYCVYLLDALYLTATVFICLLYCTVILFCLFTYCNVLYCTCAYLPVVLYCYCGCLPVVLYCYCGYLPVVMYFTDIVLISLFYCTVLYCYCVYLPVAQYNTLFNYLLYYTVLC